MLTYKKDDFDESIDDIMKSVEKIINKNTKNDEDKNEPKGKKLEK